MQFCSQDKNVIDAKNIIKDTYDQHSLASTKEDVDKKEEDQCIANVIEFANAGSNNFTTKDLRYNNIFCFSNQSNLQYLFWL